MKIFPENDYSIELNNDCSFAIVALENKTLSKEQFVANWNNQAFIGEIENNEFEVNLSKKLIGEICVFKGKLKNRKGMLEIRTGKIFKIIFIVIILFVLSGIITAIIQNKLEVAFKSALTIFIMRYFFLEFGFRIVSKIGINELTKVIGIKKLTKKTSHNSGYKKWRTSERIIFC